MQAGLSIQQQLQEVWDLQVQIAELTDDAQQEYIAAAALKTKVDDLRASIAQTSCANWGVLMPGLGVRTLEKWYGYLCGYRGKGARLVRAKGALQSLEHRAQSEIKRAKQIWDSQYNSQHYMKAVKPALQPEVQGKFVGKGREETTLQLISTLLRTCSRVSQAPGLEKYERGVRTALNYLRI